MKQSKRVEMKGNGKKRKVNNRMESKETRVGDMLMYFSQLIDEGGLLQVCDIDLNVVSHPVVVDELMLSKIQQTADGVDFWMAWRPIGLTAQFESGAFNVEEACFAHITDFSLDDEKICFTRIDDEGKNDILCILPLTEEYREEWEEWNRFKLDNRDHFDELQMYMMHFLKQKETGAPSLGL